MMSLPLLSLYLHYQPAKHPDDEIFWFWETPCSCSCCYNSVAPHWYTHEHREVSTVTECIDTVEPVSLIMETTAQRASALCK